MGKQLHVQQAMIHSFAGDSTQTEAEPDPYFYQQTTYPLWGDMPTNLISSFIVIIPQGMKHQAWANGGHHQSAKNQKVKPAIETPKEQEPKKEQEQKQKQVQEQKQDPKFLFNHFPPASLKSFLGQSAPNKSLLNLNHTAPAMNGHRAFCYAILYFTLFLAGFGLLPESSPVGLRSIAWANDASPADCAAQVLPPQSAGQTNNYQDPAFLKQQMLEYLQQAALNYWAKDYRSAIRDLVPQVMDEDFTVDDADIFLRGTGRYFVEESSTTPGRPHFEGREYPNITMAANQLGEAPLNGTSYYAQNTTHSPQVYVILLHGLGAEDSHAGTLLSTMEILTNPKNQYFKNIKEHLAKLGLDPAVIKAEAIDLVNSGNGPWANGQQFSSLKDWNKRFQEYVAAIKARENCPVVVIARSAAGGLVMSTIQHCIQHHLPIPIDGLVMVGLTHADPHIGIDSSLAYLLYEIHDGLVHANYAALAWIKKLYGEMTWHLHPEEVFPYVKTAIMVGDDDIEVSPEARRDYQSWQEKFGVLFMLYKRAEHDVFATTVYSKNVQKLKEAKKYLDNYDYRQGLLQEFWNTIMADTTELPPNKSRSRLKEELGTREFITVLAHNLQAMQAAAQDKLAGEIAKAQNSGKGENTEQGIWEAARLDLINALQIKVQALLAQPSFSAEAAKDVFLSYFSINFYPADFSKQLVGRFERWKKEIERYQREGDGHPKAAEFRQKIYEHEGILKTMLWSKPLLGKALPFTDLLTAQKTGSQVSGEIDNSHKPLETSYIDLHKFIQRNWPLTENATSVAHNGRP